MWDLVPPLGIEQGGTPYVGRVESQPLDHQGSSDHDFLKIYVHILLGK